MDEVRIELRGWKAVVVLVAVLAVSGYRVWSRFRTVDDRGREALRTWLVKDYQGLGPSGLARRVADYRAGMPAQPDPQTTPPDVEFSAVSAHGSADNLVARVEVIVDGGPPRHGRSVRYLRLMRGIEGDWRVFADSDAVSYYEAMVW